MTSKPHQDADPNAIEGDLENGLKFKPRAFNIVWGNDTRYWIPPPSSSLSQQNNNNVEQVAELVQVSWLEVTGSYKLKTSTSYQISFSLSLKGDAFGWSGSPVFLMAKVGKKGRYKWKRLDLENHPREPTLVPNDPLVVDVKKDETDPLLYFGLYEVWSGKWKGGLKIHEAIVKEKKNS
ncbi:hypothetical protein CRYUN_Cryun34aG0051700 [Craigia yunnanensis]